MTPRNQLCPCGSGKRFKHCCGQDGQHPGGKESSSPALQAINPDEETGAPILSIVMPCFRKLKEFQKVLPLNLRYFARTGVEVILVLDENSEEAGLLALLGKHEDIRWKVIVNDRTHPWRAPCKAINVGLRHAVGRHVLITSPESAFVSDVPAQMLRALDRHPNGVAVGRVGFARFEDIRPGRTLDRIFQDKVPSTLFLHTFYGSICGPRLAFEAVGGYDEALTGWGGDDDNLRVRLEMAGYTLLACSEVRLLHLSFEPRTGNESFDSDEEFRKCTPCSAIANPRVDWGRDFERIAYSTTPSPQQPATTAPAPAIDAVPTGSRRRCTICGRLIHHDTPLVPCPGCATASVNTKNHPKRPRIACLMQIRNEARYLEGCLAHLRDHVDGFIALDDGSTDETTQILKREEKLLDCLSNPPSENHAWRELDNKRRLLHRARELDIDWVLCCDADERYESIFLDHLRTIADTFPPDELTCIAVTFRELWNNPKQYRIDGVWDKKSRAPFFRLPEAISFEQNQAFHGQWYPDSIRERGRIIRTRYILYHLKSITRDERIKRRDIYNQLDPEKNFQAMGYDCLAEEGEDLQVEEIQAGREYDYRTLPADLFSLIEPQNT